jgi:hypothetical protein
MEMRFFWVGDKVAQDMFALRWHPGAENLADYQSKHHVGSHHIAVLPWYLHTKNSPRYLPRALRPSTLKGCVGTLQNGYIQNVPLPRVAPWVQSASHVMSHVTSHGADELLVPCCHVMCHVTSHGADQLLVLCSHVMSHVTSYGADHLLVPCGLV